MFSIVLLDILIHEICIVNLFLVILLKALRSNFRISFNLMFININQIIN